jgi:hypothetical protein
MPYLRSGYAIAFFVGTVLFLGVAGLVAAGQADSPGAGTVIVPHEPWSCGLPGGIPAPERGTLVFQAEMKLDAWRISVRPSTGAGRSPSSRTGR